MDRPDTPSVFLASAWLSNVAVSHAWDEVNDLVENEPQTAWGLIRAMVAYAPDYGVLSAIAAGPVETLIARHADEFMPLFRAEAARDTRFRACLRATYTEWPDDLDALIEAESSTSAALPPGNVRDVEATPDRIALLIAWFHHSATSWAPALLDDMIETDPDAAWNAVRVLLIFAEEDPTVQEDIYDDAVMPFIRKNLGTYHGTLAAAAKRHPALRKWLLEQKYLLVDDDEAWSVFLEELG